MVDVTGPVGIGGSSTGESGGLGSAKEDPAKEVALEPICNDGRTDRELVVPIDPCELLLGTKLGFGG